MSCILRIEGENFDVVKFLEETKLEPFMIFKKGESQFVSKIDIQHKTSGCSFDLTKDEFSDFSTQQKEAIIFLKREFEKLNKIYQYGLLPEEIPAIDFGIFTRMFEVEVQVDAFELELLKLVSVLNFTIVLSQYKPEK